jgi:hypothetical protein
MRYWPGPLIMGFQFDSNHEATKGNANSYDLVIRIYFCLSHVLTRDARNFCRLFNESEYSFESTALTVALIGNVPPFLANPADCWLCDNRASICRYLEAICSRIYRFVAILAGQV